MGGHSSQKFYLLPMAAPDRFTLFSRVCCHRTAMRRHFEEIFKSAVSENAKFGIQSETRKIIHNLWLAVQMRHFRFPRPVFSPEPSRHRGNDPGEMGRSFTCQRGKSEKSAIRFPSNLSPSTGQEVPGNGRGPLGAMFFRFPFGPNCVMIV